MPCLAKSWTRRASSGSSVVTAPPSPVVTVFTGWKLNVVMSAMDPTARSRLLVPTAWAASSMKTRPDSSQIARTASWSTGTPPKSTATTALVLPVTFSRIDSGETFQVSGSISANTGVAPQ